MYKTPIPIVFFLKCISYFCKSDITDEDPSYTLHLRPLIYFLGGGLYSTLLLSGLNKKFSIQMLTASVDVLSYLHIEMVCFFVHWFCIHCSFVAHSILLKNSIIGLKAIETYKPTLSQTSLFQKPNQPVCSVYLWLHMKEADGV